MSQVETEIREQPEVLRRQLDEGRAAAEAIAARVKEFAPQFVVIAARGSSDNAARYAQYLFGTHNRLVVSLAAPSIVTFYDAQPAAAGALVIGVSQSGQSPDIVSVVQEGRRQGAVTVAITNRPDSPLASAAEHTLPLFAGAERAVAATKTYTAQLCALAMLSAAMRGDQTGWTELGRVPGYVEEAIALGVGMEAKVARYRYADHFVVVGRGYNYATAFEVALKMTETSYLVVEPYSQADLLHGPMAMIDRGFPALLVAPSGRVLADISELAVRLEGRAAEIVAISDDPALLARARTSLPLPTGVPEWVSPMVAVVPGQLFAVALARTRGLDPDQPRGLSKVTETR
jgi:glucosamine--fructose-6-phosphate aminotransferase (isomerizing)